MEQLQGCRSAQGVSPSICASNILTLSPPSFVTLDRSMHRLKIKEADKSIRCTDTQAGCKTMTFDPTEAALLHVKQRDNNLNIVCRCIVIWLNFFRERNPQERPIRGQPRENVSTSSTQSAWSFVLLSLLLNFRTSLSYNGI